MFLRHQLATSIALLIFTVILVVTTIRIEVLNHRAGNVLPRHSERREDGSLTKWRVASNPSTPDEVASNQLRSVVATWGIAQYPFAIVTCALSIAYLRLSRHRLIPAIAITGALAALFIATYRAYFASLGW